MHEAIETADVGDLRVVVRYDEGGYSENPRTTQDNLSAFYGRHSRYTIGDGEPPFVQRAAFERGGFRLLARYLRMTEGIVAIRGVGMYDHSGVSYYTFPVDGDPKAPGVGRPHRDFDSGGVGYAYITRENWPDTNPLEPATSDDPREAARLARDPMTQAEYAIDAEVREYGAWANGEVYYYAVIRPCADPKHDGDRDEAAECDHAETLETVGGFVGEPEYALAEGKAEAEAIIEAEARERVAEREARLARIEAVYPEAAAEARESK